MKNLQKFLMAVACALSASAAVAQSWPARPVTLVSPFPPGGSTDTTARIVAEAMRATLGQTVVVENQGGANGSIALGRVARSGPAGYTIDIDQCGPAPGA